MQNPQAVEGAGIAWRHELDVLQARRTDLAQQLEILYARRAQLAEQAIRTEGDLRVATQGRISDLDARTAAMEKDAARTDSRISQLLSSMPAQDHPPAVPEVPPVVEFAPPPFIEIPGHLWSRPEVMRVVGMEAVGFVLLTAILCRWTWQRAKARFAVRPAVENNQLQQAVDAIAIEVERISEGQRFVTTLLNQRHVEQKEPRASVIPTSAPRMKAITPV